ncbi:MAG: SDR family oxidoreductase [Thermodesulfobacteriota bacterium]
MRRILILGAASAIAQAVARLFAAEGDALAIVGRDRRKLMAVAEDLRLRGAGAVHERVQDLARCEDHPALVDWALAALGGLDVALIAHGSLGDQAGGQADYAVAARELNVNFLSHVSLLTILANHLERQGGGVLAAVSSVAGDRGRQSNYVYGAAKAGLSAFLGGLRNRLAPAGVAVVTIKPGFVDTPMTAHIPKGLLWVGPEWVGRDIHRAILRRRDVVYTPWFWRWIMLAIRLAPEAIFKRLKL